MKFAVSFFCAAIGTLLYTRFLSEAQQFEWGRALFVGLLLAIVAAVFSAVLAKKKPAP